MQRRWWLAVLAFLALVRLSAAQTTVHFKAADGKWKQAEARADAGAVLVTVNPSDTARGQTTLVVNKPSWMALEDDEPPRVVGMSWAGGRVSLSTPSTDLGAIGTLDGLSVKVEDGANPIDLAAVQVFLDGKLLGASAIKVITPAPHAKSAEIVCSIGKPSVGRHELLLSVADASPQQNRVTQRVLFSVFGFQIAADGKSATLAADGATYKVSEGRYVPVDIDGVAPMFLTVLFGKTFYFPRQIQRMEQKLDTPERKVLAVEADLGEEKSGALWPGGLVEYEFELRKGSPALTVTSRARNLDKKQECYCFWGWLPGASYVLPGPTRKPWSMKYDDLGKFDWVFLEPQRAGRNGIGIVTPLLVGESRFGTMLFYTDPKRIVTDRGQAVEMTLTVFPAKSAADVEAVAGGR